MTLDEMLALLPDNSTGAIDAADLRAVVTGLHEQASTFGQVFGYIYSTTGGAPNSGRVMADAPWGSDPTTLSISETTADGQTLVFTLLDSAAAKVVIAGANGGVLKADITGPSVDQGTSRDIPITVTSFTGLTPINGEKVSVVIQVSIP